MELTREEAVRLHRELWKWLAENPMKGKEAWPGWDKIEPIRHLCPCCEYVKYDWNCKEKCPLEWKRLRDLSDTPCLCSYYKDWEQATAPEERSKYAALIRDLPERKPEVKQEAKYPALKIGDWVKVLDNGQSFNRYTTFFEENNLEQFVKDFAKKDTTYGESYQIVGIGKNTDMPTYGPLYVLQARDGQVYIMHNGYTWDKVPNPSLELTTAPPKYSVGDKVVPVSKTVPGFEGDIETEQHWQANKKRGYFFINGIHEGLTQSGQFVYYCAPKLPWSFGNYYLESDLIPYVEPKPKEKPETNMKEKGGYKIGDCVRVYDGLIGHVADLDYCIGVEFKEQISAKSSGWDSRHPDKQGKGYYYLTSDLEPIPSNHCPEPKTITESVTYKFKGNKTTCIIDNELGRFKGVAKCSPQDTWREETGMAWANIRARERMIEAEKKALRD